MDSAAPLLIIPKTFISLYIQGAERFQLPICFCVRTEKDHHSAKFTFYKENRAKKPPGPFILGLDLFNLVC